MLNGEWKTESKGVNSSELDVNENGERGLRVTAERATTGVVETETARADPDQHFPTGSILGFLFIVHVFVQSQSPKGQQLAVTNARHRGWGGVL
jgi:hypothetical protein